MNDNMRTKAEAAYFLTSVQVVSCLCFLVFLNFY